MESLVDQLIRHEGLRLKLYKDTKGIWTIGVGHNCEADNTVSKYLYVGSITREEAIALLLIDITKAKSALFNALPWVNKLDAARLNVLINMTFNMGIRTLLQFKNTLAAIQEGRYADAADLMLKSLWAKQVGNRAVELSEIMRGNNGVA